MIEDENKELEELLKNKISWKTIIKGTLAFLLLGSAYVLMNFFSDFGFVGIVLICLSSTLMIPQLKEEKNDRHTISISTCENPECKLKEVHDYESGDFIFKSSGACPQCGSNLKIVEIYSVKLTEKTHKRKREK